MNRRVRLSGFALLVLPVACGCYGAKVLRQPVAVDETEKRVRTLTAQQASLEAEIARLAQALEQQEELIRSLRADTQTRFQELSDNVSALGSRMDDTLERPARYEPITNYPAAPVPPPPGEAPPGAPPPGGASLPSAPADSAAPMPSAPDTSASAPGAAPPQAGQAGAPINLQTKFLYDNAYLDLNRGNYELALVGFRDFLSRDPQSDLADNAQYWIGECFYAQREFPRAIEEFARVEQNYPQGDKVPAAILKTAYALLQIDDRDSARSVLEDLINRFPSSNEAAQARAKLQSLE